MDVLQIVLMVLELEFGDEVIVLVFIYVVIVEVIVLLYLNLVMVDVDFDIFNIIVELVEVVIMDKIKVIVLVNFFGQSCDMEFIFEVVCKYNLYVVEDNVQVIGVCYMFFDGSVKVVGVLGYIGCIFFYFLKNLGVYGDGGVIYIDSDEFVVKLCMVVNYGQVCCYYYDMVGVNFCFDFIQVVILGIKLV